MTILLASILISISIVVAFVLWHWVVRTFELDDDDKWIPPILYIWGITFLLEWGYDLAEEGLTLMPIMFAFFVVGALAKWGCDRWFRRKSSGHLVSFPVLDRHEEKRQ